jgi:hypothetical protein
VLENLRGEEVCRSEVLVAAGHKGAPYGILYLAAGLLREGDYLVRLSTRSASGDWQELADSYLFRVDTQG